MFDFRRKYQCCFCGKHFGKFKPTGLKLDIFKKCEIVGGGYRETVVCPNCGSWDRERHIFLYLKNKTNVFNKQLRLLHVAPESQLKKFFLKCESLDYVTADLSKPDVMVKIDIMNIQFEENSFDVILCNHVLEHVDDDKKAMDELYRILKPEGFAILQVPISYAISKTYENPNAITPEQREKEFGQFDHVRLYGKDYGDSLTASGFTLEKWNFIKAMGKEEGKKFGLMENEDLFIVRK